MAEFFSVDDILNDLDRKKAKSNTSDGYTGDIPSLEDILNEKGVNENSKKSLFSDTNEITSDLTNVEVKPSKRIREKQEKQDKRQAVELSEEPVKPFMPALENKRKKEDLSVTQILSDVKPYKPDVFESPQKAPKKQKKSEVFYEKAKVLPKPKLDDEPPVKEAKERIKASIRKHSRETDETVKFTKIEKPQVTDETVKFSPIAKVPETSRKDEVLLRRDMELEHPDEMIGAINPYDIIAEVRKSENSDLSSDTNEIETPDFILSGDTQGIAGDDLKIIASKIAEEGLNVSSTAEVGVKTYEPQIERPAPPEEPIPQEKVKRGNTALLESLNKAIQEKRKKEQTAQNTRPLEAEQRPISFPTHALNIDYKKQIIEDTSGISPIDDNAVNEQKINELVSKRKRKIRDFVLEEIDESDDDNSLEEKDDDFSGYDTSAQIAEDLELSHKGLKVRFILLLILTLFLGIITILPEIGLTAAFRIKPLGLDVLFLDKRFNTPGFLYTNLVVGLLGMGICSTVITGGLQKLFSGKGDCDSIAAVSSLISLVTVILHLGNPDDVQRSKAYVYVAVSLLGLLFNTIGKICMIIRAKRNFEFVSGDRMKYYIDIVENEQMSRALTRGVVNELPVLAAARKTEFLTDFLKSSYCNDMADKLSKILAPIGVGVSLLLFVLTYFLPSSDPFMQHNVYWASTVMVAAMNIFSPFSMLFLVNYPLLRAGKALQKTNSVVLGYNSALKYSNVNSVLVDANSLFPAGSIAFRNIKRCQQANSLNNVAIDEAIITAASLAIKSGSILSSMFYDMIAGKSELLHEVEDCIYEVNMGISGWMGTKRILLGNREQMKHHGIKVPDIDKERKYCRENGDVVYLAMEGETVSMFFIEMIPNEQIKRSIRELDRHNVSVVIRTRDSLVTVAKLADIFEVSPENLKILAFDMHGAFDEATKYTSKGSGSVACSGTFTSFVNSIIASKKLIGNITVTSSTVFIGILLALILITIFMLFVMTDFFSPLFIMGYNLFWFIVLIVIQSFGKYGS